MSEATYEIEKLVWTGADFDEMSWHDVHVHAFRLITETGEVCFDIDYIFQWVVPVPPDNSYKFWVAPATLIFENSSDVELYWNALGLFELDGISRSEEVVHSTGTSSWLWTLAGAIGGDASLRARGYRMYVRKPPVLISEQHLTLEERGGVSFEAGTVEV
ncbi:MAG TPA: hypothetical protein VF952_10050 [Chloroflexia bacterium]|jgi:hypothetical protein